MVLSKVVVAKPRTSNGVGGREFPYTHYINKSVQII
jgi:hypothetical protein